MFVSDVGEGVGDDVSLGDKTTLWAMRRLKLEENAKTVFASFSAPQSINQAEPALHLPPMKESLGKFFKYLSGGLSRPSSCSPFSTLGWLFFKHSAGDAEALQSLRYATINSDHVDNCANFVLCNAIGESATAMNLPFTHLAQSAQH